MQNIQNMHTKNIHKINQIFKSAKYAIHAKYQSFGNYAKLGN